MDPHKTCGFSGQQERMGTLSESIMVLGEKDVDQKRAFFVFTEAAGGKGEGSELVVTRFDGFSTRWVFPSPPSPFYSRNKKGTF